MQALRNTLELVRKRLAGLPASAKLLAGSLVVIVALALVAAKARTAAAERLRRKAVMVMTGLPSPR